MALRPFGGLTRRGLLKLALGAGGAVAGGVGGVFALRGAAPEVSGLKVLSAHEYRTMASLAAAMFGEVLPPGPERLDLARTFDGYLEGEPEWARAEAKSALMLLELGPVLFERRLSTFSHLAPAERVAHFERWGTSELGLRRQVAAGFRKFLCLLFYDQPAAWKLIGYDGPWLPGAPE